MANVLIIGNFGFYDDNICGQTIRIRNIKQVLEDVNIDCAYLDTSGLKEGKINVIKLVKEFFRCEKVILAFGRRGIIYLLPLFYLLSKLLRKEVIYIAIGGWLAECISENKMVLHILRSIKAVFVQTCGIKEELLKQNLGNVKVLPNFKVVEFNPTKDYNTETDSLRVVFLSKIKRKKGLDIIRLVYELGLPNVLIDIYGPIHSSNDEAYLSALVDEFENIKYKGIINPDNVHRVISAYDIMLFPTHYEGEGFPGVILDAFIAGLPVIASDWKYNHELIREGETGHLFDLDNISDLKSYLLVLTQNDNKLLKLKENVRNNRSDYDYSELAKPLLNNIS